MQMIGEESLVNSFLSQHVKAEWSLHEAPPKNDCVRDNLYLTRMKLNKYIVWLKVLAV